MKKKFFSKKQIISFFLIVGIMVSIMPPISFGADIPSSWYTECLKVFPGAEKWTTEEQFKEQFNARINEIAIQKNVDVSINISGLGDFYINPFIYDSERYFHQLVYGLPEETDLFYPNSDGAMYKHGTKIRGEYRHIGYNGSEMAVTNDRYSAGTNNPDKKFRENICPRYNFLYLSM